MYNTKEKVFVLEVKAQVTETKIDQQKIVSMETDTLLPFIRDINEF